MMKIIISFLFITLSALPSFSQEINMELKAMLDAMAVKRKNLDKLYSNKTSKKQKQSIYKYYRIEPEEFEKEGYDYILTQDSLDMVVVEKIIEEYGYPGKSLVGEPTNHTASNTIYRSKKVETYFPMIKKAGELGEIKMTEVAKMTDKLLTSKNQEQIYGTSTVRIDLEYEHTDSKRFFWFIWPLKNPEKVNELRKEAGFKTTVEERAEAMGIKYRVYTLKEINTILDNQSIIREKKRNQS